MVIQRVPPLWSEMDETNGENGLEAKKISNSDEVLRVRHLSATTTSIIALRVDFLAEEEGQERLISCWWVSKTSPLVQNVSKPYDFNPGTTLYLRMEAAPAGFDAAVNLGGSTETM